MDKPTPPVIPPGIVVTHSHLAPMIIAYGEAMAAWGAQQERKKIEANEVDVAVHVRLRTELAACKEDAERYRFLKARCLSDYYAEEDDGTLCIHFLCDFENYNDPDAAIDKARKA